MSDAELIAVVLLWRALGVAVLAFFTSGGIFLSIFD